VRARDDYYARAHPHGGDADLVIEVGDTERNPREKMRAYMRDGRIPHAWRIDIPNRCVELWEPSDVGQPIALLRTADAFGFQGVTFTVDARLHFWTTKARRTDTQDNAPVSSIGCRRSALAAPASAEACYDILASVTAAVTILVASLFRGVPLRPLGRARLYAVLAAPRKGR
jgi:hypothetical protein